MAVPVPSGLNLTVAHVLRGVAPPSWTFSAVLTAAWLQDASEWGLAGPVESMWPSSSLGLGRVTPSHRVESLPAKRAENASFPGSSEALAERAPWLAACVWLPSHAGAFPRLCCRPPNDRRCSHSFLLQRGLHSVTPPEAALFWSQPGHRLENLPWGCPCADTPRIPKLLRREVRSG